MPLKRNKIDGITVSEQKTELVTPSAPTSDIVRISVFASSARKRKGKTPATVVPAVARRAGIFRLRAMKIFNGVTLCASFMVDCRLFTHKTAALTVMPLTAINAHATDVLYELPVRARHNAGTARDTGIVQSTRKGMVKDSLIEAIII